MGVGTGAPQCVEHGFLKGVDGMLLQKERESVVEYCRRLATHHLTKGTGGNISVCDREKKLMAH